MRLNRYIASSGYCSRRKADRLIEEGSVTVNGKPGVIGMDVSPNDRVAVNGTTLTPTAHHIYLAYNKPIGIICTSDPNAKDNIIDAVGYPERVFHIGRLDVASSGLILLTNDGDIVNAILRSEGQHEKEYMVHVDRPITRSFLTRMRSGVMLDGRMTLPAKASRQGEYRFKITLTEGRNRQIRRMCEALGYNVTRLKRTRVMNINLGDLGEGNYRLLTKTERRDLLTELGLWNG